MRDGNRHLAAGRVNQKLRTRKALLDAASEMMLEDKKPSLAEIAERALISKATAYRYFPTVEALIEEAFFEREFPKAEDVLPDSGGSLEERVGAVERHVNDMMFENEVAIRVVMRNILEAWLSSDASDRAARPGRRLALIDAALKPYQNRLGQEKLSKLRHALALVIGTEAVVATKDVCGLEAKEAREITSWAADALVRQALAEVDQ